MMVLHVILQKILTQFSYISIFIYVSWNAQEINIPPLFIVLECFDNQNPFYDK